MLLIEGVLCLLRVCRVCRALGLTGAAAFMAAVWRNTGVHSIPLVSHDIPIVSGRALVRPQGHLKKNPLTDRLIYYTHAPCATGLSVWLAHDVRVIRLKALPFGRRKSGVCLTAGLSSI